MPRDLTEAQLPASSEEILESQIAKTYKNTIQTVQTQSLDQISQDFGIVQSGEIRLGNRVIPGNGFSGIRLAYPATLLNYNNEDWNFVGINNDTLQVGIRASDGKFVAGGGDIIIDSSGITIESAVTDNITFKDGSETIGLLGGIHTGISGVALTSFGTSANPEGAFHLQTAEDNGESIATFKMQGSNLTKGTIRSFVGRIVSEDEEIIHEGHMMPGMIHTPRFSPLGVPWLTSLWAMQGNGRDSANLGNDNHLTEVGVSKSSSEETAYYVFDGAGDRLTSPDDPSLDIASGLTAHGWVHFTNALGSAEAIFARWRTDTDDRSYRILRRADGKLSAQISRLGTDATRSIVSSASVVDKDIWTFWCMQYIPSTSITLYLGIGALVLEKTENTTSIESAVFNASTGLSFGQSQTGASTWIDDLAGRQTRVGLHDGIIAEKSIYALYIQGLELFGLPAE